MRPFSHKPDHSTDPDLQLIQELAEHVEAYSKNIEAAGFSEYERHAIVSDYIEMNGLMDMAIDAQRSYERRQGVIDNG